MNDPNQAVQWSKWCTFNPVHSLSSGYNIIKTQGFWKRPRSVVILYGSFTVKTQWLSFLSAVGLSMGSSPETVKKTVTALACNMQIDQFWSASGWEQGFRGFFERFKRTSQGISMLIKFSSSLGSSQTIQGLSCQHSWVFLFFLTMENWRIRKLK